jgi:hypothetical protein
MTGRATASSPCQESEILGHPNRHDERQHHQNELNEVMLPVDVHDYGPAER